MKLQEIINQIDTINLISYPSYEDVEKAIWKDVCLDSDDEITFEGGFLEDGTEIEITQEIIDQYKSEFGFYGFAHPISRTIHYWIDLDIVTQPNIFHFFAHELSHIFLDNPLWDIPSNMDKEGQDNMINEFRAETVAHIALKAYDLSIEILSL